MSHTAGVQLTVAMVEVAVYVVVVVVEVAQYTMNLNRMPCATVQKQSQSIRISNAF